MTASEAFRAGYVPPRAGLYFNGLELLAEASRAAGVELARVIGTERDRVVARRDDALALLGEAEALQRALGVEPVEWPADARAYAAWAAAVFARLAPALGPGSPEAVAHLLGYVLGEAVATLDASALLSRLRASRPDNLWMRVQGESLEQERQAAGRRLARLASHPLLPEAVRAATAMAAHRTSLGSGALGAADEAARRVEAEAASVEAGFSPG